LGPLVPRQAIGVPTTIPRWLSLWRRRRDGPRCNAAQTRKWPPMLPTTSRAPVRTVHVTDARLQSSRAMTENVAILYGSESRIAKKAGDKEAPRCQVWTDTWIKRHGQWQVVAAQDNVIPCKGN